MKYLLQGMETRETIDSLLAFTKIESGPKLDAIYYHLVGGAPVGNSAIAFSTSQSHLTEAIETLNVVAGKAERFHELKVHRPEDEVDTERRLHELVDDVEIVARILQLTRMERAYENT